MGISRDEGGIHWFGHRTANLESRMLNSRTGESLTIPGCSAPMSPISRSVRDVFQQEPFPSFRLLQGNQSYSSLTICGVQHGTHPVAPTLFEPVSGYKDHHV